MIRGSMNSQPQELTSRNIPHKIKREVRQRCGFGCVICGMPLYEYEHMEGWANVHRHVADEITLLCDRHHREKTGGLLPLTSVREANAKPFNKRDEVSKPYDLHFTGDDFAAYIGGNVFKGNLSRPPNSTPWEYPVIIPVLIDGIPIVSFSIGDGHIFLNMVAFDEYNIPFLQIIENQLVYSTQPWDIELVGRKLTVRQSQKEILIEIEFMPPSAVAITRGKILCNGVEVLVREKHIFVVNNGSMFMMNIVESAVGLCIGNIPPGVGGAFGFNVLCRYGIDKAEMLKVEKVHLEQIDKLFASFPEPLNELLATNFPKPFNELFASFFKSKTD